MPRSYAADDADAISMRLAELEKARRRGLCSHKFEFGVCIHCRGLRSEWEAVAEREGLTISATSEGFD